MNYAARSFAEGRILLAQKLEQYAPQGNRFSNGKIAYESFFHNGPCQTGASEGASVRRRWYSFCHQRAGKNAIGRSAKLRGLPPALPNWLKKLEEKKRTKGAPAERSN